LPDGRSGGVCALDAVPCRDSQGSSTECRGNEVVYCSGGFALSALACDVPGERCLERGAYPSDQAQCALDAPCPLDGEPVCAGGRVYGCELGDALTALRDCGATGEACATVAGRALCAASSADLPRASWLRLPGGSFVSGPSDPASEARVPVTVSEFEMLEREVTVGDYAACMLGGGCTEPDELAPGCYSSGRYTRADLDAELPVTCVPTGAEWEYALRNAGQDVEFPWGNEGADCLHSIVYDWSVGQGCGRKEPWPGCSRSPDRSAQGICDLVGNVTEWTQPIEVGGQPPRRGSSYASDAPKSVRDQPYAGDNSPRPDVGFRCVR
jgi:formylglycine-generating enzyme required for sulfatase activity